MQVKIVETKKADRDLNKAPTEVLKSYQLWCAFIMDQGIDYIKKVRGYRDEKLVGNWKGYRSSRLNKQWRVIYSYSASGAINIVTVERVTPHDYRR